MDSNNSPSCNPMTAREEQHISQDVVAVVADKDAVTIVEIVVATT